MKTQTQTQKKSVLDSPHFINIMKSGEPIDPNKPHVSWVTGDPDKFGKDWYANSVYG